MKTFRTVFRLTGFRHARLTLGPEEALAYVQGHNASRWQRTRMPLRSALGT